MSAEDMRHKFSAKHRRAPVSTPKPRAGRETAYERELAEQGPKAMPYSTTFSTTMDVFLRYNAKKTAMKMMKCKLTIPDVFVIGLETLEGKTDNELREYMEKRKGHGT